MREEQGERNLKISRGKIIVMKENRSVCVSGGGGGGGLEVARLQVVANLRLNWG